MSEVKLIAERIEWIADKQGEINKLQNESDIVYKRLYNGDFRIKISEYTYTTVTRVIMSSIYQNINDEIQAITDEVAEYLKDEFQ